MIKRRLFSVFWALSLVYSFAFSQITVFSEDFTGAFGTSGTSPEGINWSSTCALCTTQCGSNNNPPGADGSQYVSDNIDGSDEWITSPIDVSNCSSLSFSMDYSSSLGWSGGGNMDGYENCGSCAGDVYDPYATGCCDCWDFFHYEVILDGGVTWSGTISSENDAQTQTFFNDGCISANNAEIKVLTASWAGGESIMFDNISLLCYESADQPAFITASNTMFCPGQGISLDVPAGYNTYSWSGPYGTSSSSTWNMSNMQSTDAGTYDVTVTDANGCTSSTDVMLSAASIGPFTIDVGGIIDICPGGEITATTVEFCDPTLDYAWTSTDNGAGLNNWSGIDCQPAIWPLASPTGTFFVDPATALGTVITICLTVTDPSNGCSFTTNPCYDINVVASPPVDAGMDLTVCEPDKLVLTATTPNPVNPINPYQWDGPTGSWTMNPLCLNPSGPALSGTYTVTVTYDNFCQATDDVVVTVQDRQTVDLSGGGVVCEGSCLMIGDEINFNAMGFSGIVDVGFSFNGIAIPGSVPLPGIDVAGGITVCYDEPGLFPTVNGNELHLPTLIPEATFTLEITSITQAGNLCPINILNNGVSITLSKMPDVTVDPMTAVRCEGETLVLTDIDNDPDVTSWDWEGPNGSLGSTPMNTTQVFNLLPSSTGTYTVTVTDANGCTNTSSMDLTVNPTPVIDESIPIEGCIDEFGDVTYDLTAYQGVISAPSPPATYAWFEDAALTMPIATPNAYLVPSTTTTVYVEVTANGCTSDGMLMLMPYPQIMLNLSASNDPACEGSALVITETIQDPNILNWDFIDNNTTMSAGMGSNSSPSLTIDPVPGAPGPLDYTLQVSDINGCIASTSISIQIAARPTAIAPTMPFTDCDADGDGMVDFDIDAIGGSIDGGNPDWDVDWYSDMMTTASLTSPYTASMSPDTIYAVVVDALTGCASDPVQVILEFGPGATFTAPSVDPVQCDSIVLPLTTPPTSGVMYYDMMGGAGNAYAPGSTISAAGAYTLYVFDPNPCFMGEPSISFEIVNRPELLIAEDTLVGCDSIALPDFTVTSMVADTFYNTQLDQSGTTLMPGDFITQGGMIYAFADTLGCSAVDSIFFDILVSPNVGMDSTITLCEGYDQPLDFMSILGNPDTGGEWTGLSNIPDATDSTSILVSGVPVSSQTFTYGFTRCGLSSTLTLNVIAGPFAGVPDTLTICNNPGPSAIVDLFAIATDPSLGPPDQGGIWVDVNGIGVNVTNGNAVDFSGVAPGIYLFEYSVNPGPNVDLCSGATNTVGVEVINQPTAGEDVMITTCIGDIIDLDGLLLNADTIGSNGVFVSNSGVILGAGNEFNTSGQSAGFFVFEFQIPQGSSCNADVATITIELTTDVTAGPDVTAPMTFCEGSEINLFSLLDPTASAGGTFVNQLDGTIITGTQWVADLTNGPNVSFEYTVGGGGNCAADMAILNISIVPIAPYTIDTPVTDPLCTLGCMDWTISSMGAGPFTTNLSVNSTSGSNFAQVLNYGPPTYVITICNQGASLSFNNDTLFLGGVADTWTLEFDGISSPDCDLDQLVSQSFTTGMSASSTYTDNLCPGESVIIGTETFDENRPTGTAMLPSASGCDSLVMVMLDFAPPAEFMLVGSRCLDDVVMVGTDTYDMNNPSGTTVLVGQSADGCDSTVMVNLTFEQFATGDFTGDFCLDDIVMSNGNTYDQNNPMGQDTLFGASSLGCDSIVLVDLNFTAFSVGLEDGTYCPDEVITLNGSNYDFGNPTGQDTIFGGATNGCDSIVMVDLDFYNSPTGSETIPGVCSDLIIDINGVPFSIDNPSNVVTFPDATVNGCDSMALITVMFVPNLPGNLNPEICQGGSYTAPSGTVYDENNPSGTEIVGIATNGCDSLVDIGLVILPNSTFDINGQFCNGDVIDINGESFDFDRPSGSVVLMGQAANGCDSIVNVMMEFDKIIAYSILPPCDETSTGTLIIENGGGTVLPLDIVTDNGTSFTVNSVPFELPLPIGTNNLEITDSQGCLSLETVTIPGPDKVDFEIDVISNAANSYVLGFTTNVSYNSINWSPASILDCDNCEVVNAMIISSTEVVASLVYGNNCITTDTVFLEEDRSVFVYVPNAFSPNGDAFNQSFYIQVNPEYLDRVTISSFRIYDRWGSLVFDNPNAVPNDPDSGWDGTFMKNTDNTPSVTNGVYVYMVELQVDDELEPRLYRGDITVVR